MPALFCVQWARHRYGVAAGMRKVRPFALAHIGEMPVKAALCPFSIQDVKKLMQKIHRLTDN